RLIALREQVQTTQSELAKKLGKAQSYVAKVENLDRRIDVVELADWLEALRKPPHMFMTELSWWQ
ncbi:MAG TPA: helix-turn-helix transcriptional regulator, partial [Telluria sp.]